jgi:hypothetical protein
MKYRYSLLEKREKASNLEKAHDGGEIVILIKKKAATLLRIMPECIRMGD